jgi:HSP20 family molecular chaperone IbpA
MFLLGKELEPYFYDFLTDFGSYSDTSSKLSPTNPRHTEEVIGDSVVLNVDLPGVKEADLEVSHIDNNIRIKGLRKSKKFEYIYTVPKGYDADSAIIKLEDGVLEIKLEKKESAKPRILKLLSRSKSSDSS